MSTPRAPRRVRALRSFVVGSVVGGAIAIVAPRVRSARRPPARPPAPEGEVARTAGLVAFEGAPCWEYDHAREAAGEPARGRHSAGGRTT